MKDVGPKKQKALRVANVSGFYGDRHGAMSEIFSSKDEVDFITGDYLAELTMFILARQMREDPSKGYVPTFLHQLKGCIDEVAEKGVKVVTNAGGLNPKALAHEVCELLRRRGLDLAVAYIDGDNVIDSVNASKAIQEFSVSQRYKSKLFITMEEVASANAYLGAFEIAQALDNGADIVICPRVTDASLVVGPAVHHFRWSRTDLDQLAGAVVAGHIVECGPQCCGGNYSLGTESLGKLPGFPIVDIYSDGSSTVTKVSGTGGEVSIGTVTEQLLYEIGSPKYLNPDVTAHFDSIVLSQLMKDVVAVSGVKGSAPPDTYKVALNLSGGYRNQLIFALTGNDQKSKAQRLEADMRTALGEKTPTELTFQLIGPTSPQGEDQESVTSLLRIAAKDTEKAKVGRSFSGAAVELALSSYPGLYLLNPPRDATEFSIFVPLAMSKDDVDPKIYISDFTCNFRSVQRERDVTESSSTTNSWDREDAGDCDPRDTETEQTPQRNWGKTLVDAELAQLCGARSGDKGGDANLGVWTWDDSVYLYLVELLSVEFLQRIMPELRELHVERYRLANLRALNFVVRGLLDEGVGSTLRLDAQAKALGEYFRAKRIKVDQNVLEVAMHTRPRP